MVSRGYTSSDEAGMKKKCHAFSAELLPRPTLVINLI
jgi:hypothetical protein